MLGTLTINPESIKVLALRQKFLHVLKNLASWYFGASTTAPITDKECEIYDTRLRSLIIDHVLVSLSKKNILDKETKHLLRGSADTTDSGWKTPWPS